MVKNSTLAVMAAALTLGAAPVTAQVSTALDSSVIAGFPWRAIGPVNMGGRITDIEAIPSRPNIFYVAAAAGGIWKTVSGGTQFFPLFNDEKVISMGDIALAPSNPNIIYAGTGEEDSRNSISPGGGMYKSTDAGVTWQFIGLEKTEHIGRVVVHPTNPDIVYVAALGAAWRSNPERGLYKSTDGGRTWTMSKFISDKAGFVDVAMDPRNPDVLYAAAWERVRGPYFLRSGGPGSGLWKTTDGGATWTEISGGGFPASMKGRIGIAIAPSNPDVIYTMVEADRPRTAADVPRGAIVDPNDQFEGRLSGLYRSADGGRTWTWMNRNNDRPFYYSQVRVDPKDENRVYRLGGTNWHFSNDGGKTWTSGAQGHHVDHHAMWINPNNPEHFIIGSDGGVAQTFDRGGTYDVLNHMPLGQFYAVSYDFAVPYRVCGGLQDNGSWCGPSRKRGQIISSDWFNVGGGDGFWTAQDPRDPNIIYSESQGGAQNARNIATGQSWQTRGSLPGQGGGRGGAGGGRGGGAPGETTIGNIVFTAAVPDSLRQRMQGLTEMTNVTQRQVDSARNALRLPAGSVRLATPAGGRGAGAPAAPVTVNVNNLRWNWNTPFFVSMHNPDVYYSGSSRVMKSTDKGRNGVPISPDLTGQDVNRIRISTMRQAPDRTGGITPDVTQAETNNSIVSLAESPLRPGVLWAGTDDGKIWFTRNDGGNWEEVPITRFTGVPARTWVSHVELSAFDSNTVYVSFDNHQEGDFKPYVFMSTDFGRTFRSISSNLPTDRPAFVHVVREDPVNRNLLFVGTDVGVYASLDRGATWQRFMTNLGTVPVHDLKIHPRDREIIAGTHGRSIWIADIAPLQQMADSVMRKPAHLFQPAVSYMYTQLSSGTGTPGHKGWSAGNSPYGAQLAYYLNSNASGPVRIVISDAMGDTVSVLTGTAQRGLNRVSWAFTSGAGGGFAGGRGGGGGGGGGRGAGPGPTTPIPGIPAGVNPRPGEGTQATNQGDPSLDTRGGGGGGGGGGGRGGFGGGDTAPAAGWSRLPIDTGNYVATLVVGNQQYKQLIQVKNIGLADPTKAIDYRPGTIMR